MRALQDLSEDDRRTIYEGDLCRTLAASDGYKWFVSEAERILGSYENAVCSGMASWDDYKHAVGIIDGIRHILGIVPATVEAAGVILGAAASDET